VSRFATILHEQEMLAARKGKELSAKPDQQIDDRIDPAQMAGPRLRHRHESPVRIAGWQK